MAGEERCGRAGGGEGGVEGGGFAEGGAGGYAAPWVDDAAYAGIGGADEGEAFLDGAQAGSQAT